MARARRGRFIGWGFGSNAKYNARTQHSFANKSTAELGFFSFSEHCIHSSSCTHLDLSGLFSHFS